MSARIASPFTIVQRNRLERTGGWRLVRRSLGLRSFGMNLVELSPGQSIPEHDEVARDQEEVFVMLEGSAAMVIDGRRHPAPGEPSYASIPSREGQWSTMATSPRRC